MCGGPSQSSQGYDLLFLFVLQTFALLRKATYPPAAVNVLDVSSESMAAFQVFTEGAWFAGCVIDDDGGTLRGRCFAMVAPMPFEAPETSATWPASFWDITFPSISGDSVIRCYPTKLRS
jgi:hypothetical protein